MSSCSRALAWLTGLALALAAPRADALNVHAVYRTACARDVGVILKVEKREIQLLRLDGTVVKIPRHEIVSLLYYSLSQFPLPQVPIPAGLPAMRVQMVLEGEVVDLVHGWPIDYSDRQVSFLLRTGKELVIERDSIWSIRFDEDQARPAASPTAAVVDFDLVHPQTSGFCTDNTGQPTERRQVFAQQILNDPIVIRRELDRLAEGYEQILEYENDQKFYPKPFLYIDRTMLGLWVSLFSRYGGSPTRSNNFTPLLVDELALGPFRYQHIFLSGAAPNDMLLHHEAQSQIYYRFKAAYFHTAVFFDPNLLLVGTKYRWTAADLADEVVDDRLNEIFGVEFGFDWGPVAVQLAPAVFTQSAVKFMGAFDRTLDNNLWRAGLRLTFRTWQGELMAGLAHTSTGFDGERGDQVMGELGLPEWKYQYARLTARWETAGKLALAASAIARKLDYEVTEFASPSSRQELRYESTSLSGSVQAQYPLSRRFSVGGLGIVELHRRESGADRQTRVLPRFALFTGFWF